MTSNLRPAVLIVARSGRMLAEAARERWAPWVIDMFADADLRALASGWRKLESGPGFEFDDALFGALKACIDEAGTMPVVLGSGFEQQPDYVARIAQVTTLAAASPMTLRELLDIPKLYARLRHNPHIDVPQTRTTRPRCARGWLRKSAGMSGGFHVQLAGVAVDAPGYYQRFVPGRSLSAIFVANSQGSILACINRHLSWHEGSRAGFHYQGAVTWRDAPAGLTETVTRLGVAVAHELGLRGLFGLDFVKTRGADVVLVDINPRPPATLDLMEDRARLFDAHIAACTADLLLYSKPAATTDYGHLLLYADASWTVPEQFAWPTGASDRPNAGERIAAGAPLCTIRASGETAREVITRLAAVGRRLHTSFGRAAVAVLPRDLTISTVGGAEDVRLETR